MVMELSLQQILILCNEHHVKRFKHSTLEIEFSDKVKTEFHINQPSGIAGIEKASMPSDTDLLFAATEGLPEDEKG